MKRLSLVCLSFVLLVVVCVDIGYQSYAQTSEEESNESLGTLDSTRTMKVNSTTIEFKTFKDEDFGLEIIYPSDWNVNTKNLKKSIVMFSTADNKLAVILGTVNRVDDETLKEFGERYFKNRDNIVINEYYRNPNTTLAGFPSIKMVGTIDSQPNIFSPTTTKYVMYNNCVLGNRDLIFETLFVSRELMTFNEFRPIAEKMIGSLKLIDKSPIIQEQD